MDRKVKSFRLRVDLLGWVESYAAVRGSSQIAVVESALEVFRGMSEGGVPDLPVVEPPAAPKPKFKVPVVPSRAEVDLAAARAEHARNMGARQAKLNEAKARASR